MLQTCFLCKYRHVLTLSRRNWLHSAGGQREISQRAQVRREQREERGAHPQSLSSFWCSIGRSGYRAEKQKPDEACFSEASREQERLGKGLWAQTPGISFTGSLLFVPRYNHWTGRRWQQQPLPSPELRETHSKASVEGRPLQDQPCSVPPALEEGYSLGFPAKPPPVTVPRDTQEKRSSKANQI